VDNVNELGSVAPRILTLESRPQSRSLWYYAIRHLRRDRLSMVALWVLLALTLSCLFAPPIVEDLLGVSPERTNVANRYRLPGTDNHILGTDQLGRDQFVRLLYGGRVSLGIAYAASVMSISIGMILGMIAGFYGGWVDDLINWFISTLSSIPALFLLILVSTVLSPRPETLVLILSLLGWITTCRLVRGEVLALKERDFILAARALGVPTYRVITHHLFPNIVSLVIVSLTLDAGSLILVESGLSFLGLGVRPPTPSWGNMLTTARTYFVTGVHLVIWPGLLIAITVLCFYVVGDGLRDALDPRSSKR
jgi:peptide/nickel transport system permease protein